MSLHEAGYAPTTLGSVVLMIKKKTVSLSISIPSQVCQKLKWFLDQKNETHKPRQSDILSTPKHITYVGRSSRRKKRIAETSLNKISLQKA